jgi:hypothetical protein
MLFLGLKEEQNKSQKLNYHGNITTICFRKKDGDIRYLTPLNREQTEKNTVVSKNQESNISIIKMVISY